MIDIQPEWNDQDGELRETWKTVPRMLRMEGIEDVIEEKMLNDRNEYDGELIVANSIKWDNRQGMNLPKRG
ncbi:hypothetical protein BLNAU_4838 [Blattamonas nauphoetae]|nr:hypothetical protein BLNAU_4838 [Blattamonas nauphoetae]